MDVWCFNVYMLCPVWQSSLSFFFLPILGLERLWTSPSNFPAWVSKTAEAFGSSRHWIPTQIVVVCCIVPPSQFATHHQDLFFFVFRGSQHKVIHLPLLTRGAIQITPMKSGGCHHFHPQQLWRWPTQLVCHFLHFVFRFLCFFFAPVFFETPKQLPLMVLNFQNSPIFNHSTPTFTPNLRDERSREVTTWGDVGFGGDSTRVRDNFLFLP